MTMLRLLAAAAAFVGIGAGTGIFAAAPAFAQPNDPFAYQNPGEQILQGVIDSLLGNRYAVTDRRAVRRCADAALDEAIDEFGPRRRDRRGNANRGWRDWRSHQMRVTAITSVERRPTGLRVRGLIDSGLLYALPARRAGRGSDLMFRCNIDYRGRISAVRVDRNPDFRPPRPY